MEQWTIHLASQVLPSASCECVARAFRVLRRPGSGSNSSKRTVTAPRLPQASYRLDSRRSEKARARTFRASHCQPLPLNVCFIKCLECEFEPLEQRDKERRQAKEVP